MIRYANDDRKMFEAFSSVDKNNFVEGEPESCNFVTEKALIVLVLDNSNFNNSLAYTVQAILSFKANFLDKQITLLGFTNSRLDFMNSAFAVATENILDGVEEDFVSAIASKQATDLAIITSESKEDFLTRLRQQCKILPININTEKSFYLISELAEGLDGSIISLSSTAKEGHYNFSIFSRNTMDTINFICYMNSRVPDISINPHKNQRAYFFKAAPNEGPETNEFMLKKTAAKIGQNMIKQIDLCEKLCMDSISETNVEDYMNFRKAIADLNHESDLLKAKIKPLI